MLKEVTKQAAPLTAKEKRQERLRRALRANLERRRQQQRERRKK